MAANGKPPFRADHVGSLLRPQSVLDARARRARGEITAEQLRIEEAAQYVAMEQLALSPQCGFSSTVEGDEITQEQQFAKLAPVIETARDVWG